MKNKIIYNKITQIYKPPNDILTMHKLADIIKKRHIHKDRYGPVQKDLYLKKILNFICI